MIQKMSHATIYCVDQEKAREFYVDVLGMEVRTDAKMENGHRWLTIGPKGQPDLEIALMPIAPGMMDADTATTLRGLVEKGGFGVGVFQTADVHATVTRIKNHGGRIMQEPAERPYGIEALVRDPSGNWFSLCQRPA